MIRASLSRQCPGRRTIRWGRCFLLVTASIALAYVFAALTFLIRWMHFWISGPHFLPYVGILLTLQAVLLLWWVCRHQSAHLRFASTVIYSLASGYAAGLLAMVLYPLFQPDGVQQMLAALRFSTIEGAIAFFSFPVRLLTWLFGGITGGILVILSRRWRQESTEPTIASAG